MWSHEMLKKIVAVAAACAGCLSFAGVVDHGDYTGFPNVNVDAHLKRIADKHFPEIAQPVPAVMIPRRAAWNQDIRKAAAGLNVKQSELDAMVDVILDPDKPLVKAPHENLLEFELYAAGMKNVVRTEKADTVYWKKILALPLEKRRYTTIPVIYQTYRINQDWSFEARKQPIKEVKAALDAGCVDTQGCYEALFKAGAFPYGFKPDSIDRIKLMFRSYFVNFTPQKSWRYTNRMDSFSRSWGRGEGVYSGWSAPDFIYTLKIRSEETLRKMCQQDPAIRDLIVAIGLTNRHMENMRKVAFEFARQSEINYPILALRLPLAEAQELLKNYPEHHKLRDLLVIKSLKGEAKIKAIDEYVAKYPDYTPADMPKTSIALNTHAELHALAGAELFKLGRPMEAAERWVKGCAPEDIALVAEQVMTIEQLIAFCDKHFPESIWKEFFIYSDDCAGNDKLLYPDTIMDSEAVGFCLKNLLARRLMRAGRFEEAKKYFSGVCTRYYAEQFFEQKKIADSATAGKKEKAIAYLNMALLVKTHGNILFGTFLEPDNLICDDEFPCVWGTKQKAVKLNKPNLKRKSYRFIAAKYYGAAAELTSDKTLKGNALWMAGTLIKKASPKDADVYFKKLYYVNKHLTRRNWFLPEKEIYSDTADFVAKQYFSVGPITEIKLSLPTIPVMELPKDQSPKALLEYGKTIIRNHYKYNSENILKAMYALKVAGDKGLVEADVWNAVAQYTIFRNYISALAFLRKAEKQDPDSAFVLHELAHVYHTLGYWKEGVTLFHRVADTKTSDKEFMGLASYNLVRLYANGKYGVKRDLSTAKYYLKKAREAGCEYAEDYKLPKK